MDTRVERDISDRVRRSAVALLAVGLVAASALADIPEDSPVAEALRRAEASVVDIVKISADQRTFDNTIGALDDIQAQLELDTNMVQFLAYVSTDRIEREQGRQATQDVEAWLIDVSKREDLYHAVKAYAGGNPKLYGEQERLLAHTMRDYRRAGMQLTPDKRDELTQIQKEISRLSIAFDQNINDDETMVPLTREELDGLPDSFFDNESLKRSGDIYLVGMSYPQFLPIMDYCDDETTRKKVWLAYKRRGGQRNVAVIEQIIQLRHDAAKLLGYAHPADYETEVRMSKNAATVMDFYEKLRPLVRVKAERDYQQFVAAKRGHTGNSNAKLFPWDMSFYQNRLKKTEYAVDSQQVREYFPLERVIEGLFSITQSLYGLEYKEVTAAAGDAGRPLWHDDVRLFEVYDTATGERLGDFYFDLHPRDNKYGHAAQWGLAQHKVWSDGRVTKPLAALVCNFTKPTADKPSLLTHDEVETFFHEFGHCLHTILSEANYWRFAGTGVERDFVEAPSQMFENWIWDTGVLKTFARHYETEQAIPSRLVEGMIRARHLGSGMLAEHQFYYGLVDMTYHTAEPGEPGFTTEIGISLFSEVELYDQVPSTHFQAAFGHLTGYQAGYYGYQWSLVYASDMFQRFKELGMLDPQAGRYYRRTILARGGAVDGLDLVRDYLAREPDLSAYLAHLGLNE